MDMTAVYLDIQKNINSGLVFALPRKKLEQFVAALSMANAYSYFGASEFPGTCETVRMALSLRFSEDANLQAKKESRIALIVSFAAFAVGCVSAFAAIFPSPIQVYATPQKPVYAVQAEQSLGAMPKSASIPTQSLTEEKKK